MLRDNEYHIKEQKKGGCGCKSGGCNKLSTYDWLEDRISVDPTPYDLYEVSFKNGSRKDFYRNSHMLDIHTGDWVIVTTSSGYDVGQVTLSGDLVRLQMKKKNYREDRDVFDIQRLANERDLEKLTEARAMELSALHKAKKLAASLNLDMKLGDVEYQGDKRKATFYYTAEGRVDFRELVKIYAREFRVKIEMRQIGIRQESSRIGGIASCGRELCCSSWLTNFSSVTTEAARYQNIAINQSKLTGLCGRLKCCLNFELDTYIDALEDFPKDAERLETRQGTAILIKTDIFKGLLYYSIKNDVEKNRVYAVHKDNIDDILAQNQRGEKPESLGVVQYIKEDVDENVDFADVTGQIELPVSKKKKKKGGNRQNSGPRDRERFGHQDPRQSGPQERPSGKDGQRQKNYPDQQQQKQQQKPRSNEQDANRPKLTDQNKPAADQSGQPNQGNNKKRWDKNRNFRGNRRPDRPPQKDQQ